MSEKKERVIEVYQSARAAQYVSAASGQEKTPIVAAAEIVLCSDSQRWYK
jgi:hypothetical protein